MSEEVRPEGALATLTMADKNGELYVVAAVLGPMVLLRGGDPMDVRECEELELRVKDFKVVLP